MSASDKPVKKDYAEKILNEIRAIHAEIGMNGFKLGKWLWKAAEEQLFCIEGAATLKEWLLREGMDPARCTKLMQAWRHAVTKSGAIQEELDGVNPELIYQARKVINPKNKDRILSDAKKLSKPQFLEKYGTKKESSASPEEEEKPTFGEGKASGRDVAVEMVEALVARSNEEIARFLDLLASRLGQGILGVDFVSHVIEGFDEEEMLALVKVLVRMPNLRTKIKVKFLAALASGLDTDDLTALNIEVDRILGSKMKAA